MTDTDALTIKPGDKIIVSSGYKELSGQIFMVEDVTKAFGEYAIWADFSGRGYATWIAAKFIERARDQRPVRRLGARA